VVGEVRFGSLFSGIGGFDLGFERAGLSCAWQVEIDHDCRKVLAKRFPDVSRYTDVKDVKAVREVSHGEAPVRVPSATERVAGPALMVQAVREQKHAREPEAQLQTGTTKALAVCDSIQNHSRTSGQDDRGTEWSLCDLPETNEAPVCGSLPPDQQGARRALSPLQRKTSHGRRPSISESGAEILAPVDIICAGFPCQDLSVAGKRAGLDGARSSLFYDVIRIVREMREQTNGEYPAFLVLENVPGIFSSDGGRDFAVVLREVAESGAMDIGWAVLDAQWFGVAQRRRRMFLGRRF
jgi:site-specific DNA-cytosine methylase